MWATRPEAGLYVVLVLTTDEGRRAEDIWPAKPASAEAETGEAGQAAAPELTGGRRFRLVAWMRHRPGASCARR